MPLPRGGLPARRIRARLLRWYRDHHRDLPWRRTRDPYAIWVAEVMLQQTRVDTVVPYFQEFLERFPTPASLAAAKEEEVLAAWSGLGYYRRARSLHSGARAVMERHAGRVPSTAVELLAIPGVGRYTAGAIASIAYDRQEPVLDGNVRRVLCRLRAADGSDRALWELASDLVVGRDPGTLNQALMELGALVCTPRKPACPGCPLRSLCRARASGRAEHYPSPRARRPTEQVGVAVAWIRRAGRALLERPADGSPFRGSWDLPAVEVNRDGDGRAAIEARLKRLGLHAGAGELLARMGHGIMYRRLSLEVFDCRLRSGRVAGHPDLMWADPVQLDGIAVSGATRKVVRALPTRRGSAARDRTRLR
jgi:A/G-specific adenine glycosylase